MASYLGKRRICVEIYMIYSASPRWSEQLKEEVRRLEQFYQEMPQEMEKKNDL